MTAAAARAEIRGLAAAGRYLISGHARERMKERNVREGDLRQALVEARACTSKSAESWRVEGPDLDGDELTVVVVIDDGLLVVTVF